MFKAYREWRLEQDQEKAFNEVFDEITRQPRMKDIRAWTDEQLHDKLVGNELWPATKSMAQSDLKRREAWRGPQRWSLILSVAAIAVSVCTAVFK